MSRTVDEKVVEMRFDNQDFERNVDTSINSIKRLKDSLDFSGVSSGFDSIGKAAGRVDLSGIGTAIESVQNHFSALEVMAISALNRITNEAITMGINLAKSLSFDQVSAGFSKYEEKTKAVQTIMAATGLSVEDVNSKLEKLTWYADETSYSFTDMVSNVGKFTAAGVDLDDAITAMTGIANEAAVSGQGITQASRAMYNFAQALGTGVVQVRDWMSIENANMATMEFKQTILDTAVALGKLQKVGDKYLSMDLSPSDIMPDSDKWITPENFRSTLASKWFTNDVLIETLKKYGSYSDAIYEIADGYDTCAEAMAAFDAQADISGDAALALGQKAFKAGQVSKTFTDAVNAVKDAVSTGWLESFEIVFGNFDEATALWTDFNDALWRIFASGIEGRNKLLQAWKDEGGRDALINGITQLYEAFMSLGEGIKKVFHDIFPEMTAQKLLDITKGFESFAISFRNFIEGVHQEGEPIWKRIFGDSNEELESAKSGLKAIESGLADVRYMFRGGEADPITEKMHSWAESAEEFSDNIAKLGDDSEETLESMATTAREVSTEYDELANAVIRGLYGNGQERKDLLGDQYAVIQNRVNEIIYGYENWHRWLGDLNEDTVALTESTEEMAEEWMAYLDEIANDVILGNYGNGEDRKVALAEAGYDYDIVQNRVNEIIYGYEEWHEWLGDINEDVETLTESTVELGDTIEEEIGITENKADTILTRIQRTFKGIFAIADIVGQAFSAVGNFLSPVIGTIPEIIWNVTGFTASIGDFLVSLDATIREGNVFGNAIQKVADVVSEAFSKILEGITGIDDKAAALEHIKSVLINQFNAVKEWAQGVRDSLKLYVDSLLGLKGIDDPAERSAILWEKFGNVMLGVGKIIGGFLSAINMLGSGIRVIFSKASPIIGWLITHITNLIGVIFGFSVEASDAVKNLDAAIKETGLFGGVIKTVTDAFTNSESKLAKVVSKIAEVGSTKVLAPVAERFKTLGKSVQASMSDMLGGEAVEHKETLLEKVVNKLKAVGETVLPPVIGFLSSAFNKIKDVVTGIAHFLGPALSDAVSGIGTAIKALGNFIAELAGDENKAEHAVDLLLKAYSGSMLAVIIKNISNFASFLSTTGKTIGQVYDLITDSWVKINDIIAQLSATLRTSIEAYANIQNLKTFATSILILAGALFVLSLIDTNTLVPAVEALIVIFALLKNMFTHIKDAVGGLATEAPKVMAAGTVLLAFSISIAILASALKKISKVQPERLGDALLSLIGIISLVTLALNHTDFTKLAGSAAALVAFGAAIWIMVTALKKLVNVLNDDTLDESEIGVGLFGIVALVLVMSKAINKTDAQNLKGAALGMVGFAAAVFILVEAVKTLSDAMQGGKTGTIFLSGVSIMGLLFALGYALSKLPAQKALAAALAVRSFGVTIGEFVSSILILADAFSDEKKAEGALAGLVAVMGLMAELGMIFALVSKAGGSAGTGFAFLEMGTAILILAGGLALLSTIPWQSLLISLGAVAVVIIGFAAAAALLRPVLGPMQQLANILATFGAACALVAVGMVLLTVAIANLVAVIATMHAIGWTIDTVKEALTGASEEVPAVIEKAGFTISGILEGLVGFIGNLISMFIGDTLNRIWSFLSSLPKLLQTIVGPLCDVIIQNGPVMAAALVATIINILAAIDSKAHEIFSLVGSILSKLVEYLKETGIPKMVKAGFELVGAFIEGFWEGLKESARGLRDSLLGAFGTGFEALCKFFGVNSPSTLFRDLAANCVAGFTGGMQDGEDDISVSLESAFGNAFDGVQDYTSAFSDFGFDLDTSLSKGILGNGDSISSSFSSILGSGLNTANGYSAFSDRSGTFYGSGANDVRAAAEGLKSAMWTFTSAVENVLNQGVSTGYGFQDDFVYVGNAMGQGIAIGLREMADGIRASTQNLGQHAMGGISTYMEINSPAKRMIPIGMSIGEGVIVGMEEVSGDVADASASLGVDSFNGLKDAIQRAGDISSDDLSFSPTIRPVIDLSNVSAGGRYIQNLLNGTSRTIDIAGSAAVKMDAKQIDSINGIQVNNQSVVDAITAMRGDISTLSEAVRNMQIVMDTGTLVGAIANPMDTALGRKAVYAGRGI